MAKKKAEDGSRIHVLRCLIVGEDADFKAAKARWKEVAKAVQRAVNDTWMHWLTLHVQRGTYKQIRQYIDTTIAWHAADPKSRGPKPKCEIKACDNPMQNAIYHLLTADHPGLHSRPLVLALHKQMQRMATMPATKSAFPRWIRVLAGEGEFPSSSRPLPIPFDVQNGELLRPDDPNKQPWKFAVRVDRIAQDGKTATSHRDVLHIKTGGRNLAGLRVGLQRIADGEWKMAGSDLVFRESTGEWYLHLVVKIPQEAKPQLDPEKKAILAAGRTRPFFLLCEGRRWALGGFGHSVVHVRRQLMHQRRSRSESHKMASSARKGHGRKRAQNWREKYTRRWQDFVKTRNGQIVQECLRFLLQRGIGTLTYASPPEAVKQSRRLTTAGKGSSSCDPTGWDWYQFEAMLRRKSQENGIGCEVVSRIGHEKIKKNARKVRKPQAVAAGSAVE